MLTVSLLETRSKSCLGKGIEGNRVKQEDGEDSPKSLRSSFNGISVHCTVLRSIFPSRLFLSILWPSPPHHLLLLLLFFNYIHIRNQKSV